MVTGTQTKKKNQSGNQPPPYLQDFWRHLGALEGGGHGDVLRLVLVLPRLLLLTLLALLMLQDLLPLQVAPQLRAGTHAVVTEISPRTETETRQLGFLHLIT